MKMIVEFAASITPGVHTATITEIKSIDTSYGKALKFFFSVNDIESNPNDEPQEFITNGICSANRLTPDTKLYQWLSILNGRKLDNKEEVDLDKYIGKNVEILVVNSEREGREYSNVTEIIKVAEIPF